MPNIRFLETDNSGIVSTDISTVFVPGSAEVLPGLLKDNWVHIPSSATDLSLYFVDPDYDKRYAQYESGYIPVDTVHLIEMLIAKGYGIDYYYIEPHEEGIPGASIPVYTLIDNTTFVDKVKEGEAFGDIVVITPLFTYDETSETYEEVAPTDLYDRGTNYYYVSSYVEASGGTRTVTTLSDIEDWDFLRDPNIYNMKYITTGVLGTVPVKLMDTPTNSVEIYYLKLLMYDEEDQQEGSLTKEKFDALKETTDFYTYDGSDFIKVSSEDKFEEGTQYYIRSTSVTTPGSDIVIEDTQGTQKYVFDFSLLNKLLSVCGERKDCSVLVDLDYYDILNGIMTQSESEDTGIITNTYSGGVAINGNELAVDYKTALEYDDGDSTTTLSKSTVDTVEGIIDLSSRAYSLMTNATMSYVTSTLNLALTVPASFVYLYEAASIQDWKALAGVQRAVVGETFTPDIEVSKFCLDKNIITNGAGVSFNAIVYIRNYGYTIWGDRTLIEQLASTGVKGTSYYSIRNLISDVTKIAYESAITYTYETNNDITWLNFKNPITQLLDEMTTSGVISGYKIKRKSTSVYNKMIAHITIYAVYPLEDYDITVAIENSTFTVEEG